MPEVERTSATGFMLMFFSALFTKYLMDQWTDFNETPRKYLVNVHLQLSTNQDDHNIQLTFENTLN